MTEFLICFSLWFSLCHLNAAIIYYVRRIIDARICFCFCLQFIVGDVIFIANVHRRRCAFARLFFFFFGPIICCFFFSRKRQPAKMGRYAIQNTQKYRMNEDIFQHTHTLSTLLSTHFKVDEQRNSIVLNAVFRFNDENERTKLTQKNRNVYIEIELVYVKQIVRKC